MKDLKRGTHSSIFPVKLLMAYIVSFCLLPTITFWLDFGDQEGEIEGWNSVLELSLIFCVPLLWVIYVALRYSRRMPVYAVVMALIALWLVVITLIDYYQQGFDNRLDLDLQLLNCLIAALVWVVPFVVTYLVWRFWPRKQAIGLPAS
jgi:hypothetical protein